MRKNCNFIRFAALAFFLTATTIRGASEAEGEAEAAPASAPADSQPSGVQVLGLVLNYLGGGLSGARVRIESLDASSEAPPLAEAETNKGGEINLLLPETVKAPLRVRIKKDGYKEWVGEIDPTDEDNPPFIDATLDGAARITGVVRSLTAGKPVAGAKLTCDSGGRNLVAKTGADGRYKIENVVQGPARLRVQADGFATKRIGLKVDESTLEQDIELAAERPVELTVVTNEGDPADGVAVEAWLDDRKGFLETITDASGKANLRGIDEEVGQVRLRLNGDRYVRMAEFSEVLDMTASQPAPVSAPAGPATLRHRVVVQIGATVSGKVVDQGSGEPIVGVRVVAGPKPHSNMPVIWSSVDGTYELTSLPPGPNIISFQHTDHATEIQEIQLKSGQRATMDAKLGQGKAIGGKVVTAGDEPVTQAWVTAEEWKGYETVGLRTVTAQDGTFTFPHAPEGEITFSIVKPGASRPVRQVMTAGKTDYRIELELAAPPAGGAGPVSEVKVPVSRTVPDFTLTGVDGTTYKLSELKGKYVFLDFWASWCPPCVKEMPNVKALHEATKNRSDFVLIGCNLDSERKDFKEFVEKNKITWPQVSGPKSGAEETFEMLDGMAIPYTCLIGPDGKLLAQHIFGAKTVEEVKKHLKD